MRASTAGCFSGFSSCLDFGLWTLDFGLWLRGGGLEGAGGGGVHVVEVDFFDEAHGQLVVDKEDLVGGVDARAEVLAHPPETQVAEDGDRGGGSSVGAVGLEHFGPNDVIAIEGGAAIGSLL